MMRQVEREEMLDYVTYNERRERIRQQILETKKPRRVHVGEYLTFLFENHDTVWYHVQEMMRVEQIVREADIRHELDTYNELLGGPGQLGCTLLVEIDDRERRERLLREWRDLPRYLYVKLESGEKIRALFDPRQVGEERLSSVQYLKFDTRGQVPVAVGSDHPRVRGETSLDAGQRRALAQDLEL